MSEPAAPSAPTTPVSKPSHTAKWAEVAASLPAYDGVPVKGRSPWQDALRRLKGNKAAMAGLIFVILSVLACFVGPSLSSYPFDEQYRDQLKNPPSGAHWMGTDIQGRDLMVRVMTGGQISFMVAFIATSISITVGVAYGAIAGLKGGRLDNLMMRIVDVMYGLPYIFIVIIIMVVAGDRGIVPLFIGLGMVSWLTIARIVRGQVIALRHSEFVTAARVVGARSGRIIVKHLLPNLLGIIAIYATLTVPRVMLEEAFLSYLGLGVTAPNASWGSLAKDGMDEQASWWLVFFPTLMMFLTLMALNFIGDGLRDALDPKEKKV